MVTAIATKTIEPGSVAKEDGMGNPAGKTTVARLARCSQKTR